MAGFERFQSSLPINLILGGLGAGKSSLLQNLLSQKPADHNWGILINEFGNVDIDSKILTNTAKTFIKTIPAGCICCSAVENFSAALDSILQMPLDRIFIEPSGISDPAILVNLLERLANQHNLHIDNIIYIIDATSDIDSDQSLIAKHARQTADVVVINKSDLTNRQHLKQLKQCFSDSYPAKQAIITTTYSQIDLALLYRQSKPVIHKFTGLKRLSSPHLSTIDSTPFDSELDTIGSEIIITEQFYAIGWIFNKNILFDWKPLERLFDDFKQRPEIIRAKGLFCTGKLSMLFQYSNGHHSRENSAYQQDSRLEIIFNNSQHFSAQYPPNATLILLEEHLKKSII
ncbi:GTP-binding protein [Thiomicrorhabdus sediminis]|uniref:GTP-binding protein n=1 Tax=Thiomicrorhabdus sediminis TaxID=2580412 RepID=A0A4P9K6S4_9GAMM|nr:GTP-binding protein [Thiomicrorhabdus sediminis]QCU90794.1 GTP-binding protein [Thiomicrorhabdus sediminis]